MKRYVVGFLFSKDRLQVALIVKKRPAWQAGCLNGIGGKVEPHESPLQAMVREFKEETGVEIPMEQWEAFVRYEAEACEDGEPAYVIDVFRAFSNDLFKVRTVTDERVEIWEWWEVVGSRQRIVRNLSWMLPLALDPDLKVPIVLTDISHRRGTTLPTNLSEK